MLRLAIGLVLITSIFCFLPLASGQGATCDPQGDYSSDWGPLHLNATGATGYYTYDSGRIQASFANGILKGKWSEEPTYAGPNDAGTMELEFTADCSSFSGNWKHDSDAGWAGTWAGTRTSGPATTTTTTSTTTSTTSTTATTSATNTQATTSPTHASTDADCDMTGDWETSQADFTLALQKDRPGGGDFVYSESKGSLAEEMSGTLHGRTLTGVLVLRPGEKALPMTMNLAADCESFIGTITNEDGSTRPWSGTRTFRGEHNPLPGPGTALLIGLLATIAIVLRRRLK